MVSCSGQHLVHAFFFSRAPGMGRRLHGLWAASSACFFFSGPARLLFRLLCPSRAPGMGRRLHGLSDYAIRCTSISSARRPTSLVGELMCLFERHATRYVQYGLWLPMQPLGVVPWAHSSSLQMDPHCQRLVLLRQFARRYSRQEYPPKAMWAIASESVWPPQAAWGGLQDSTIQALGRSFSSAFLHYIRTARDELAAFSSSLATAQSASGRCHH